MDKLLAYAVLASAPLFMTGCGVDNGMDDIYQQVAQDAVDQYNLALKGNDPIEICVHAGMVVTSYNQAKDEANYLKWKKQENADCRKAGLR